MPQPTSSFVLSSADDGAIDEAGDDTDELRDEETLDRTDDDTGMGAADDEGTDDCIVTIGDAVDHTLLELDEAAIGKIDDRDGTDDALPLTSREHREEQPSPSSRLPSSHSSSPTTRLSPQIA